MTLAARRPGVPRTVVTTWALASLLGVAVVGTAVAVPPAEPRALSPRTLSRYLAEAVPANADNVRVNGFYGSGHSGLGSSSRISRGAMRMRSLEVSPSCQVSLAPRPWTLPSTHRRFRRSTGWVGLSSR